MKRYIDGREFIQNLSGKWEPSPHQLKLDKDKADEVDRIRALAALEASKPAPAPAPMPDLVGQTTLAVGIAIGLLF